MQIDPLKTLSEVIETGSFADAARRLGYSPSAISQQMSKLERDLRLVLFERSARQIFPTQAALYLNGQATELVGHLNRLEGEITRMAAGEAGQLRVGSYGSAAPTLLAEAVAKFLVRRREVSITLSEGEPSEMVPLLVRCELDVALVFSYQTIPVKWPSELQIDFLLSERLQVVASPKHRLAARATVHMEELERESWIATEEHTSAYRCLLAFAGHAGFAPNIRFQSASFETICGLVGQGLGVALIPEMAIRAEGPLRVLSIKNKLPIRHVYLASRRSGRGPLVEGFCDAVRSVAISSRS